MFPIGLRCLNPQLTDVVTSRRHELTQATPIEKMNMWCSCFLMLIHHQGGHQSDFGRRTDLFLHLGHEHESGGDSIVQRCPIFDCPFLFQPFLSRVPSALKNVFFAFWRGITISNEYDSSKKTKTEPTTNHFFEVRDT